MLVALLRTAKRTVEERGRTIMGLLLMIADTLLTSTAFPSYSFNDQSNNRRRTPACGLACGAVGGDKCVVADKLCNRLGIIDNVIFASDATKSSCGYLDNIIIVSIKSMGIPYANSSFYQH
jgi:hypothetical protein